jgi:hypothetical protein
MRVLFNNWLRIRRINHIIAGIFFVKHIGACAPEVRVHRRLFRVRETVIQEETFA